MDGEFFDRLDAYLNRTAASEKHDPAVADLRLAAEELCRHNAELCAARQEADRARQRYQELFDQAPDSYVFTDSLGIIREVNLAAARMFHLARRSLTGRPLANFIIPEDRDELRLLLSRAQKPEQGCPPDTIVRVRPRGTRRLIEVSVRIAPSYSYPANLTAVRWLLRDVTQQRQAELEIRTLNTELEDRVQRRTRELEQALNARDQFLAMLSHELRTPLTPVLVEATALVQEQDLPPSVRRGLKTICRNVELEARLIDDLLDLTRISRNMLRLRLEVVDLHALVAEVLRICHDELTGKHLKLELELAVADHHVRGDSARLQQVLWNLLKNAVKFTPRGGRIIVRSRPSGPDKVCIEVADTGVGIEPEVAERMFDAFYRRGRHDPDSGGLGLGLAIARAVVEAHHGRLSAHSDGLDQGATFSVELSTAAVPAPQPAATPPGGRHGPPARILLVEDHPDTLRVMSRVLRQRGYAVVSASTVAAATKAALEQDFDVLISDLGLPDGSGLDLIRQLRLNRPIRGIAVSGYGMDTDLQKTRDAGFSQHLIKPIKMHELETAIEQVTG